VLGEVRVVVPGAIGHGGGSNVEARAPGRDWRIRTWIAPRLHRALLVLGHGDGRQHEGQRGKRGNERERGSGH
jgi:hypothetical protein